REAVGRLRLQQSQPDQRLRLRGIGDAYAGQPARGLRGEPSVSAAGLTAPRTGSGGTPVRGFRIGFRTNAVPTAALGGVEACVGATDQGLGILACPVTCHPP